jgi:hypothetical protein
MGLVLHLKFQKGFAFYKKTTAGGGGFMYFFPRNYVWEKKKKKNHFLRLLSSPDSRLQRTAGNALLGVKLTF